MGVLLIKNFIYLLVVKTMVKITKSIKYIIQEHVMPNINSIIFLKRKIQ